MKAIRTAIGRLERMGRRLSWPAKPLHTWTDEELIAAIEDVGRPTHWASGPISEWSEDALNEALQRAGLL